MSLFAKLKTNTDQKNYEKSNEKDVENNISSGHWKKNIPEEHFMKT